MRTLRGSADATAPGDRTRDFASRLPALGRRWRSGELDGAGLAARYFLYWQIAIHGREFASRRHRDDPRPDAAEWLAAIDRGDEGGDPADLAVRLERYQFRAVGNPVPGALAAWLRDRWPLEVREDVPAALEVLRMQAQGRRLVTIITDWPRASEPVLSRPDAFAFFLHDLEHAWKFCHSPELYAGQRDFFARLEEALDRGVFATCLDDAGFRDRFHYLASDMNTHPEHSRQYLRAILIEHYGRGEGCGKTGRLSDSAEEEIAGVLSAVGGVTGARPPEIAGSTDSASG